MGLKTEWFTFISANNLCCFPFNIDGAHGIPISSTSFMGKV